MKRFSMSYYDSSSKAHPFIEEVQALKAYRGLVVQFVARAIKTRYKRSVLGVVWTMLNPLLTMIVLTVVFSQLFRIQIENFLSMFSVANWCGSFSQPQPAVRWERCSGAAN